MKYALIASSIVAASLIAGVARADGTRVLVIPFSALNVPESQQWMSKGVQESLVTDFSRSGNYSPVAFHGKVVVEDNATAARLARQASTPLAIRGVAQVVGGDVRLTAQLIDAKSGETVTAGSVTGPASDLLKLEDQLSAQLRGVATDSAAAGGARNIAAADPQGIQSPAAPVQPQVIVVVPPAASAPSYVNPTPYYYGASYAGFGTIYPGYFPGIITVVSPGSHHHGHDDHGHHGGSNGGGPVWTHTHTGPSGGPLTITMPAGGITPTSGASFGALHFDASPTPKLPAVTARPASAVTGRGRSR